jgi:hypothetical protein
MNINRLIKSFEKFRKQYLTVQFRLYEYKGKDARNEGSYNTDV